MSDLDDLRRQFVIQYAPIKSTATENYFKRMAAIEDAFYEWDKINLPTNKYKFSIWKQMTFNESLSGEEREKLEVFEYPVSDKYTNLWTFMKQSKLPENGQDGILRVLESDPEKEFIFIGKILRIV